MGNVSQSRSGHVINHVTILIVGISIAVAFVVIGNHRHNAAPAEDDEPVVSKDTAIARVERLGGKVQIDGESSDQPVWGVNFEGCRLQNDDLRVLASFPALEVLNLADTAIDDVGLKYVGVCRRLTELDLSATKITDLGLSQLVKLKELSVLKLNQTSVTDEGILRLAPLPKLSPPGVFETRVTDAGLQRLNAAKLAGASLPNHESPSDSAGTQTANVENGRIMDRKRESLVQSLKEPCDGQRLNKIGRLALISSHDDAAARDRAVEFLERAVQAEPVNDEFKLDLADAYALLNLDLTLALATELYEQVLERRPDDQQLLGRLVKAYSALENAPRAFEFAERRLKLVSAAGTYDVALQIVGIVAAGGKLDRGIKLMHAALARNSDDQGTQLLLATLEIQAKNTPAATLILRRVLEQSPVGHPHHETAQKLLNNLEQKQ